MLFCSKKAPDKHISTDNNRSPIIHKGLELIRAGIGIAIRIMLSINLMHRFGCYNIPDIYLIPHDIRLGECFAQTLKQYQSLLGRGATARQNTEIGIVVAHNATYIGIHTHTQAHNALRLGACGRRIVEIYHGTITVYRTLSGYCIGLLHRSGSTVSLVYRYTRQMP